MTTYAARTEVSAEKSRQEIENTVRRYGATSFAYASEPTRGLIAFVHQDRQVRFIVPLPDRNDREFTHHPSGARTVSSADKVYEQAIRQRWRAMALIVKSKLEAVETGIVSFEAEFYAFTVLPNGRTVYEESSAAVTEAITTGTVRPLIQIEGPR